MGEGNVKEGGGEQYQRGKKQTSSAGTKQPGKGRAEKNQG